MNVNEPFMVGQRGSILIDNSAVGGFKPPVDALEQRISDLETAVRQLQRQMLDISELLGRQSNLIVTLSSQQTDASRLMGLVRDAVTGSSEVQDNDPAV